MLRGLVMVVMALDHVRDYFTSAHFDATDLTQTTAGLFLTRWVTHFCAPTFVLLAGTSAWLASRRRSRSELAGFLLKRGLWLVLLEFTVVSCAWYLNFRWELGLRAQVIWAIGLSMIALAGLVYFPRVVILTIALAIIAGHNLLDRITPLDAGALETLWRVLHVQGQLPGLPVFVTYPLLPWIGVMALGYLLGPVLDLPADQRRQTLVRMGLGMIAGFLALRMLNVYGDPAPWSPQRNGLMTLFSFINVTKYPASLQFLLITLGPALVGLALLERLRGPVAEWLRVFGRVPLFYYVAHLYVIHLAAIAGGVLQGYSVGEMAKVFRQYPTTYGYGLPVIYVVWIAVVVGLYPLCHWFGIKKQGGRAWWWSYL
ncbi:MAG TPA: heparan-alpha-glucosaminide N-acetyltransferase domain-containing protein, partial [Gemmatimonadales bacterium]|nr:heparan-alpha-glucosaminide N-acetyltransferase domain-containing protein [Gemmatimonadales bacterium]